MENAAIPKLAIQIGIFYQSHAIGNEFPSPIWAEIFDGNRADRQEAYELIGMCIRGFFWPGRYISPPMRLGFNARFGR